MEPSQFYEPKFSCAEYASPRKPMDEPQFNLSKKSIWNLRRQRLSLALVKFVGHGQYELNNMDVDYGVVMRACTVEFS